MSNQAAQLLSGKPLAEKIQEKIKISLQEFSNKGLKVPFLQVFQVSSDPSAAWYIGQQQKLAEKLGLGFKIIPIEHFENQKSLLTELHLAGDDASGVHGIFMTMPLPKGFDSDEALLSLNPKKDIEGIHPTNLGLIVLRKAKIIPPTALAAFRLIEASGISLRGKKATVVGQSAIVGRPLQLLLGENRVTTVVCNTGTLETDLQKAVSESDIVVACAGSPGIVKGAWIKPGAVVIDVGTTEVDGKLVGDVEFEAAKERAGFITPVPGGVGPLTVTMLMDNLITAYRWQMGLS